MSVEKLCELMRGLEFDPALVNAQPNQLYLIGRAVCEQAKEAVQLQDRLRVAEAAQVVDVRQLIADYEAASDDHGFDHPHPIFLMAKDIDNLRKQLAERDALIEASNKLNETLHDQLANIENDIQALKEQKPAYQIDYQYDEGHETPELGGDFVLNQLDGKEYPIGTLLYAAPVIVKDCK